MSFIDSPSFTPPSSSTPQSWCCLWDKQWIRAIEPAQTWKSLCVTLDWCHDNIIASFAEENRANRCYRYFNIFRDFIRGGGTISINAGKYNPGLECFCKRDLYDNFRHNVDSQLFMISLSDIKWQGSHDQQHMLPLYQGPIILSQQTGSLQQVISCPWSFNGSQLLEPAWCDWQPQKGRQSPCWYTCCFVEE